MSQAVTSDASKTGRSHHKLTTPFDSPIARLSRRIGGPRAKEVERFIKFGFVGVLGFLIDSGTVLALQNTLLPPVNEAYETLAVNVAAAQSVAFVLAVCSNFVWNRLWTYPDSRSRSRQRQLTQFAVVSFTGWAIRTFLIDRMYVPLGDLSTSIIKSFNLDYAPELLDQYKLGTMIALLIGVIVVMIWNFLANRYWTYNDVE